MLFRVQQCPQNEHQGAALHSNSRIWLHSNCSALVPSCLAFALWTYLKRSEVPHQIHYFNKCPLCPPVQWFLERAYTIPNVCTNISKDPNLHK